MTGSADLFNHDGRSPRASINHVTVHDGFTLADLVSYERKHNEANGEDNRDGSDENDSTNCGVEGPTDDPEIVELRRQLRRNLLSSLMLAQGVPLLLAGDEVGNSQGGNNNAYCQDNQIGWVDWSALGPRWRGHDVADRAAYRLRRRFPQLRRRRWVEGRRADGSFGVLWLTPQRDRDDGAGLEFSGRTFPRPTSSDRLTRDASAALRRAQRCARDDRLQAADAARIQPLDRGARTRADAAEPRRNLPSGAEVASAAALGSGVFGGGMNGEHALRSRADVRDGVTFRLWAPAAKRVELMLDRPHPMQVAPQAAGTKSRCRARAPARATSIASTARSRCRIRRRTSSRRTCPDQARSSITNNSRGRRRTGAGGRGQEAAFLELHVGTFTLRRHVSLRDRASSITSSTPD